MKKPTAILTAAVLTAALTATGVALADGTGGQNSTAPGTPEMGQGMMGQGTMPRNKTATPGKMVVGGMGYGMMGGGMGHGMMRGHASPHHQGQTIDRNLSADDVRKVLDGHFAWMGHKRLQVGDVKTQNDGTLLADVNTIDGSLVMRMKIDPKTGAMRHVSE